MFKQRFLSNLVFPGNIFFPPSVYLPESQGEGLNQAEAFGHFQKRRRGDIRGVAKRLFLTRISPFTRFSGQE
jgi:hypothetical protein